MVFAVIITWPTLHMNIKWLFTIFSRSVAALKHTEASTCRVVCLDDLLVTTYEIRPRSYEMYISYLRDDIS